MTLYLQLLLGVHPEFVFADLPPGILQQLLQAVRQSISVRVLTSQTPAIGKKFVRLLELQHQLCPPLFSLDLLEASLGGQVASEQILLQIVKVMLHLHGGIIFYLL